MKRKDNEKEEKKFEEEIRIFDSKKEEKEDYKFHEIHNLTNSANEINSFIHITPNNSPELRPLNEVNFSDDFSLDNDDDGKDEVNEGEDDENNQNNEIEGEKGRNFDNNLKFSTSYQIDDNLTIEKVQIRQNDKKYEDKDKDERWEDDEIDEIKEIELQFSHKEKMKLKKRKARKKFMKLLIRHVINCLFTAKVSKSKARAPILKSLFNSLIFPLEPSVLRLFF